MGTADGRLEFPQLVSEFAVAGRMKKPVGAFLRYKTTWLSERSDDEVRQIIGSKEAIPVRSASAGTR
jgi:hypothetical protein